MLSHIHINDFAIVQRLDLDLTAGFTVLTGETGAGKSILIDALGLVLGDRADSTTVRHGADKADISALFDVGDNTPALSWLRAQELDSDSECLLRRTVNKEGGSRCYINGTPTTVQAVRELGEMLVDIHGQHAHQSLMKAQTQRILLDDFGKHGKQLAKVQACHRQISALLQERKQLSGSQHSVSDRLELLRYQLTELHDFQAQPGEPDALVAEHSRLAHAQQILETGELCLGQLNDDSGPSVVRQFSVIQQQLSKLQSYDESIGPVIELLTSAQIQAQEGASELRHYLEHVNSDPQRLQWVDQRLSDFHDLARKHQVDLEQVPALADTLGQELAKLETMQQRVQSLDTEIETAHVQYWEQAKLLASMRTKSARILGKQVTAHMQELGLKGALLEIQVTSVEDDEGVSAHGCNRIEFLVSTNPGQPPRPLAKVASGGELSRISLCIQVVNSQYGVPTLIFDEVDVGVGGSVAELVGQKLRALGSSTRQVLCVTHLPQVAALGHHHLQVSKHAEGKSTRTGIHQLLDESRILEIARMLGGLELTDQTVAHAREMVQRGAAEPPPLNCMGPL